MLKSELRGRPDSAMAILSAALAKYPLAGIPPLNRPYVGLVIAYARMGKPGRGAAHLEGVRGGDPRIDPPRRSRSASWPPDCSLRRITIRSRPSPTIATGTP